MGALNSRCCYISCSAVKRKRFCKATTRRGTPCQCKAIKTKRWRCRLRGGLSTGPKTEEGRARISAAVSQRQAAERRRYRDGQVEDQPDILAGLDLRGLSRLCRRIVGQQSGDLCTMPCRVAGGRPDAPVP